MAASKRISLPVSPIELRTIIVALESMIANQDDDIFQYYLDQGTVLGGEVLQRFYLRCGTLDKPCAEW